MLLLFAAAIDLACAIPPRAVFLSTCEVSVECAGGRLTPRLPHKEQRLNATPGADERQPPSPGSDSHALPFKSADRIVEMNICLTDSSYLVRCVALHRVDARSNLKKGKGKRPFASAFETCPSDLITPWSH